MEHIFDVFESVPMWAAALMAFGAFCVGLAVFIAMVGGYGWLTKPRRQLRTIESEVKDLKRYVKNIDENVVGLCNDLSGTEEDDD